MKNKKKLSIKSIVAIGIGAALFFLLGRFVAVQSPIPDTTINIQYGILSVISVIYGPLSGVLCGFLGHTLIDMSGDILWWSWIIASSVFGLIVGFVRKKIDIGSGKFGVKEIFHFNIFQMVAHIAAWIVVAPVLDILIFNDATEMVFMQGAFAATTNIVTTAFVGTGLLTIYTKIKKVRD